MKSKKIHRKKRRKQILLELEPLMQGVKAALTHDLLTCSEQSICQKYERGMEIPGFMEFPPYVFKRFRQVRDFDKRIIWSYDRSFAELASEALLGFRTSQQGFNLPEPLSRRAALALHHAANICQLILGEFSYDRWFDSCSYGKRASYKLPRSNAYLDEKLFISSGTDIQRTAFKECLSRDMHLFRAVRSGHRAKLLVDRVKASAVPKSYKSARIIAPDTILGGFLSRGLGDYIRKQLEVSTHIDLSKQQERHRRWACTASKTGRHATIDMSKASDSFVWRHIECIVPKSWHHALQCVRTEKVQIGEENDTIQIQSYMLMGSGHTFPLQTLLFYCLAESVRTLLKCKGRVSVYGDDIIVPVTMSRQLIDLFNEIGFTINSDKSFYDEPDISWPSHTFFRESCGGDYKGGVDVRPYMPECDLQSDGHVPRNEYLAWVHKVINGLLDRWSPEEIPLTIGFLLRMITGCKAKVCFVPSFEVDHSGIRHFIPSWLLVGYDCSYVTYNHSYPVYWRLTFTRKKRKRRVNERPYQWYAYYLQRNKNVSPLPLLFELLHEEHERVKRIRSYEPVVSLNGEPDRGRKGIYRWKDSRPPAWKKLDSNGNLN